MRAYLLTGAAALALLAWAGTRQAETQQKPAQHHLVVFPTDSPSILMDPAGNPLSGVQVTATDSAGRKAAVRTDQYGEWSLLLFPGTYRVSARHRFWSFTPAYHEMTVTAADGLLNGVRCPFVVRADRR